MNKLDDARKDYEQLLKLEPNSKLAQIELNKLSSSNLVYPIVKTEDQKSKKPLVQIKIEEINTETHERQEIKRNLDEINKKITLTKRDEDLFKLEQNERKSEQVIKIEEIGQTPAAPETPKTTPDPEVAKVNERELLNKPSTGVKKPIVIPERPVNGYQFKKDWQFLADNLDNLATYLKKIPPIDYEKLFLSSLESDHLSKILEIFNKHFIK